MIRLWFSQISSAIFTRFFRVVLVCGCSECLSSSTKVWLPLNRECHSKHWLHPIAASPYAWRSISRVSVADLPNFTQNFTQTHCWCLSFIFQNADNFLHYLSSPRLQRMNSPITTLLDTFTRVICMQLYLIAQAHTFLISHLMTGTFG